MLDYSKCPCYTCLVKAVCPGREPTPEEHDRMWEEMIEDEKINGCQCFLEPDEDSQYDDYEIPELEAQQACPLYREWAGWDKEHEEGWLGIEYVGIENPKMKVIGG